MKKQNLRITYHPAKKQVKFERFGADGSKIAIRNDSVLFPYMQEKGTFILQDHGDLFFQDIARAFDGEESVNIEAVMTKTDFGDFEQMIEHYNEENDVKMNATLLAELPDMNAAYKAVKQHGEKAIGILACHRKKFYENDSAKESVIKYINSFSEKVEEASKQIRNKINVMSDNNIDLCFAGVYSCGKSTLINAILGYRILPEAISSKTARMFTIRSPKKGEPVRICFFIGGTMADILWDGEKQFFIFGAISPTENVIRRKIQETINTVKNEPQHVQIYKILEELNQNEGLSGDIDVYFPIPLDRKNMQFTIYDTPGTDSNYAAHKVILEKALESQTNSILIFVASPNKLEGEGNHALLSYLKEAEQKGGKTTIDLDRSLFVINYIDEQNPDTIKELQHGVLKCKEDEGSGDNSEQIETTTIQLSNKKLLFTSAKYGYAAQAVKNGIADKNDQRIVDRRYEDACDEEFGRYYQFDRVATSECARVNLIRECEKAMEKALEKDDREAAMLIGSGVYALEREIQIYGDKYASAVKTAAIIESVDNALAMMNSTANSLEEDNQREINQINAEINALRQTLRNAISENRAKYEIRDNQLPEEDQDALHINAHWIMEDIHNPAIEAIRKILGKILPAFNPEKKNGKIEQKLKVILGDYANDFRKRREKLLTTKRNRFIEDISSIIKENGDISNRAKVFVCDIVPPIVKGMPELFDMRRALNNATREIWLLKKEYINRESYIQDAETEINRVAQEMVAEYRKEYSDTLEQLLDRVQEEFSSKIDQYSLGIQSLEEDKKAMEKLREKIVAAEMDLEQCQKELDDIIWAPKGEEQ